MSAQPRDPCPLAGRRALVTGAASGIGAACVAQLLLQGARVIALDRDAVGLKALDGPPHRVDRITCDLADLDGLATLPLDVDILVNNAGIQHIAPVQDFPPDRFDQILAIMLQAPFRLIRQVLPHMYDQRWGRIVNVSSVHGLRASEFKAAYVAAKHGLEGLSKVVAIEGGAHGVTSICVNPAYVRTPLVEGQVADQAASHGISEEEVLERIMLEPVVVKRLVEPGEVADLVGFLCGPSAASVTGSSYVMDGGWTAR
jgi:3-hydroxybutyrate dehydrogenase